MLKDQECNVDPKSNSRRH